MSINSHSLGGYFPYKMDAKCRVSMPSDWRLEISNDELKLLLSSNEKLPTLRVLTATEFDKMKQEVQDSELSPARKRIIIGTLHERCTSTRINEQGKLIIPKALLDHPGLKPGEGIVLCGRGDYIEILNEKNYQKLCTAREATLQEIDESFGFF